MNNMQYLHYKFLIFKWDMKINAVYNKLLSHLFIKFMANAITY